MGFFSDDDETKYAECKECHGEFNPDELKDGVCKDCSDDSQLGAGSFFKHESACNEGEAELEEVLTPADAGNEAVYFDTLDNAEDDPDFDIHTDLSNDDVNPGARGCSYCGAEIGCMCESSEKSDVLDEGFFDEPDTSVDWAECQECGNEFHPGELENGVCEDCAGSGHKASEQSFFKENDQNLEEAEDPDFQLHDLSDDPNEWEEFAPGEFEEEAPKKPNLQHESVSFDKFIDSILIAERKQLKISEEQNPNKNRVRRYTENHTQKITFKGNK